MKFLIAISVLLAVAFFMAAMPVAIWSFAFDFSTGVHFTKALANAATIALDIAIIGLVNLASGTVLTKIYEGYSER